MLRHLFPGVVFGVALVSPAWAQPGQSGGPPAAAIEVTAGHAGFVDDATIGFGVVGAAFRLHLTPRVSVGPEVTYLRGPDDKRNFTATGNITFDVLDTGGERPRVMPFLVAGVGVFRSSDRLNGQPFSQIEAALTGGGGIRVWLGQHVYAASEVRIGWEPHLRVTGTIGFELPE
jgi:hypothetical protein